MILQDWRGAPADALAGLYEQAQRRWADTLGWDTSANWREIEKARTTWGLPGLLVADDAGCVRGWTYFFPQRGVLQVGGIVADTPRVSGALVEALRRLLNDSDAEGVSCFAFDEAPGVVDALHRAGFDVEPFHYLSRSTASLMQRSLDSPTSSRIALSSWSSGDLATAATLLRRAYSPEAARHFAPGDTQAEWERYLRNLIEQTGLGRFLPEATRVARGTSCLDGLVIVTALSSDTAHIAQLAVDPSRRGEKLALRLVEDVCEIVARLGFARVTLLAGDRNTRALSLYERLGFVPAARFIAAHLSKPVA